ncbi:MAG: hypothetical protein JXA11_08070 [Phycisphaerae bacterium]|nr:hypothetical protein [Phycisphaerae bacterium]
MSDPQRNSDDRQTPSRLGTAGLLLWMLGVMLFGWFLLDGPAVSSIVKRVGPLKSARQATRCALGEPAESTAATNGDVQP